MCRRAESDCSFDGALAAGCDAADAVAVVADDEAAGRVRRYTVACIRYMVEADAADAAGAAGEVDVVDAVGSVVSGASGAYGASAEGGGSRDAWRDGR